LFFLPLFVQAQGRFAPLGAKWVYGYCCPDGLPVFMHSRVNDDMFGQFCRELIVTEFDFSYPLYVYSRNDSVWYGDGSNEFALLYHFTAQKGDSWEIPGIYTPDGPNTMTVTVDSVGTVLYCNRVLKVWHVSFDATQLMWHHCIVECMGNLGFLALKSKKDSAVRPYGLRCYEDPVKTCRLVPYRCDRVWAGIPEPSAVEWESFPNPARETVSLQFSPEAALLPNVQVINQFGQVLLQHSLLNVSTWQEIPVGQLPKGLYFVICTMKTGLLGTSDW